MGLGSKQVPNTCELRAAMLSAACLARRRAGSSKSKAWPRAPTNAENMEYTLGQKR